MIDKDMQRVIENNRDVVDFIKEQLDEEAGMSKAEINERIFAEFKYIRFAGKRMVLEVLIAAARKEYEDDNGSRE